MNLLQRAICSWPALLLLTAVGGSAALHAAPVAPPKDPAATAVTAAKPAPLGAAGTIIPGADVSASLRAEYLAGDPILVTVRMANAGTTAVTVPDLTARPWLVSFLFTRPGKTGTTTRRTTPPTADPGQTLEVRPRGQRQTLLEIPTSSAMPTGTYSLTVQLELSGKRLPISTASVSILPPAPILVDLGWDVALDRSGWFAPWLHRTQDGGTDLYLHQAPFAAPGTTELNHFLARLSETDAAVRLTVARANEAWNRYVVWPHGERGISYVRLQGQGQPSSAARTVDAPWPKIELLGRGVTDSSGRLLQPIWVPAPKTGGEVRIATIDSRGEARFQRLARLDQRPADPGSVVDGSGSGAFLLPSGPHLDLYVMRVPPPATEPKVQTDDKELPVPGKRIWRGEEGTTVIAARFGTLPVTDHFAGGIAVLVAVAKGEVITTHWLSMDGRRIIDLPHTRLPPGTVAQSLVPNGYLPAAVVGRTSAGGLHVVQSDAMATIDTPLDQTGVVRMADGTLTARSLKVGGPIGALPLTLRPVPPG